MKRTRLRSVALLIVASVLFCILQSWIGIFVVAQGSQIPFSRAECVMEATSRRILYESSGDLRLPMASTTKIATALTVLNTCKDIKEKIIIPDEVVGIEGSSVYLKYGEEYTVEELLYGLMLRSGNDCATALALYCAGDLRKFSVKMNEVAKASGAICTNFRNPHGLPCENHYTTARDLSLITCKALENPKFREIVGTQYYAPRHWKNKNKMLSEYQGAIGVKTGFTKQAGRCLVTAAERNGMMLVCTVLNSPMMYERSAQLLDDAFSSYSYEHLLSTSDVFEVETGKGKQRATARTDFFYPLLSGELENVEISFSAYRQPLDREIIGQIQISIAKRLLFCGNLYKL